MKNNSLMDDHLDDGLYLAGDLGESPIQFEGAGEQSVQAVMQKRALSKLTMPRPSSPDLLELDHFGIAETVDGIDDRVRIDDTDLAPWRMICSLILIFPSGRQGIGTGWLAAPNIVVTAGHNLLHPTLGWVEKVIAIPGRDLTHEPFGSQTATEVSVAKEWNESFDAESDIGVIWLPEPFVPHPGHFSVAVLNDHGLLYQNVHLAGYPKLVEIKGVPDPMGRILYHHYNQVSSVTPDLIYYSIDTSGGNSGAPVWIQDGPGRPPLLVGVHAYGFDESASGPAGHYNYAPRMNRKWFELLRDWIEHGKSR